MQNTVQVGKSKINMGRPVKMRHKKDGSVTIRQANSQELQELYNRKEKRRKKNKVAKVSRRKNR